ncbi:MAG: FGGY family carbohydrate kinase [Chloroflexota bacterium]
MWLAYDIGTSATKAALIDATGRVVASAEQSYETHHGEDGIVEQHAPDWWQAVREVTQNLAPDNITGIAVTGQMQNVILLASDGTPVHPVILYSDTRAKAQAEAYTDSIDVDTLRRATGNKQGEGADGLPAKLLWLAQNRGDVLENAAQLLLGAADFVVHRMTGVFATDTTTASTTGLMNMAERGPLAAELLPSSIQPVLSKLARFVPGGTQVGGLSVEAADALGLPAGIPVHIGPGDAGATTLGAGSRDPGTAYGYLGTSGWIGFSASQPSAPESGVITIAHPDDALVIQVAPLLTAGGNLEQALAMLGAQDYEALLSEMAPNPVRVIYLPYLNGERSPFIDPLARAAFIGIGANDNRSTLTRAVVTGVAYGYRHALDELTDTQLSQITFTGGGTRSAAWMQIFADVLGVPVQVAANAEHIGVIGAVVAASVTSEAVTWVATYTPNMAYRKFHDEQYRIFREAYPALKDVFAKLPSPPEAS